MRMTVLVILIYFFSNYFCFFYFKTINLLINVAKKSHYKDY